jgi:hypothetical protein
MILVELIKAYEEYADYKYTETRDGDGWGVFRVWLGEFKYEMLEPHRPDNPEHCFRYLENIAGRTYAQSKIKKHPIKQMALQYNN